jgi:hypothetical protein
MLKNHPRRGDADGDHRVRGRRLTFRLTDAQIRAEIGDYQAIQLTVGPSTVFVLFISSREGSCFTSANASCAYTQYCGYHSHFKVGSEEVIYANLPYANLSTCQEPGTSSPNGDVDAEASITSREITESITGPL